ncbi:MAG: hypothetical protein ACOZNI_05975 [Myxococcota bacterium]
MSLLAVLASCTLPWADEDEYWERFAKATCERTRECSRGYFDSEWSDVEDCTDDLKDQSEDAADYYDDCEFDDEQADECLTQLREASCEELYEDGADECARVWDCEQRDTDGSPWE